MAAQPASTVKHNFRVVALRTGPRCPRHFVSVKESDEVSHFFIKVKQLAGASLLERIAQALIGRREALFQGYARLYRHTDLEANRAFVFIDVDQLDYLPHHTYAYQNPDKVPHGDDFVKENARFHERAVEGSMAKQRVIVRGWETCWAWRGAMLFLAAAFSVGLGMMAGFLCHNAGIGISVSSGVIALLSFAAVVMIKR